MRNIRKMLLIALIDALASEVYLNFLGDGFRISVSVILLPIIYYFNRKINPLITAFFVGTVGLLFRGVLTYASMGSFSYGLINDAYIMIFDLVYGLVFYCMFTRRDDKSLTFWFLTILIADFSANTMELFSRLGVIGSESVHLLNTLLVVACIRSLVAIVVILIFKAYKRLLSREEHEERYRNLLTFISDLKGELYFMKSNMESIEAVMGDAYTLFENLTEEDHRDRELALQIAKDVHEIKKNYYRVVSGIEQISQTTLEYNYMSLHELFSLLETSMSRELELTNRQIDIFFNSRDDVLVKQHYMLMSILRNLVANAIEAMDEKSYGRIDVNHIIIEQDHLFTIVDNGKGIKEKDLPYIFDSGYSTKFNRVTGDIYRGLGLTLVKDIVEQTFKGKINVASIVDKGTRIELVIPGKTMEV
ncbi:MAG: sensor histidine kinase [Clostridia bacterium]|nr:sensor histidine kinase [Clostridia bacterium]